MCINKIFVLFMFFNESLLMIFTYIHTKLKPSHLNSCVHVAGISKVLKACWHLHCLADLVLVHILHEPDAAVIT